jgi:predicted PurR-regulated permease PerM
VALAYLLWRGTYVLLLAFAGALLAVFLATLSDWLHKSTRIPYGWALTIVVLLLLGIVGGITWGLANQLISQAEELSVSIPKALEQIRKDLSQEAWGRLLLRHLESTSESVGQLDLFPPISGVVSGVLSFLVAAVVILFVGIFGAAEADIYREGALHLVPTRRRQRMEEAVDAVTFNLRWWLLGQVFSMVVMWMATTLGLWLIGVPSALTLGLIAGLLELIPFIGPWVSAVPAALVALILGPYYLLLTLALYLALHLLEGYVLLPLVQRQTVLLPPALTILMQVLLGELLGLLGLILAAPLTVALMVLLKMLYIEDALGDDEVEVPGEVTQEEKMSAAAT